MELRQVALEVARILQDAGKHALNDQMNPRDLKSFEMTDNHLSFTSDIDKRLAQFISNRITYVDVFDGFWQFRPEECHPGERYWCVGGIDGAINFVRSMPGMDHHRLTVRVQRPMLRAADPFGGACSGAWPDLPGGARIRSHPHPQDARWRQTREDHAVHHPVP